MKISKLGPVFALLAIAGCSSDGSTDPVINPTGNFRFVSGVHGNVNVLVDGTPVLTNVTLGSYVGATVAPGSHTITIQKVGGAAGVARTTTISATGMALVIGTDSAGAPRPSILLDTNAVVPAGATKLRVANFAAAAVPITAWRTQPDFGTMIRVQFPFPYNAVSPYMQSTPGDWRVMISSQENTAGSVPMPDTLANSGLIPVASGSSRTVVVVDGAVAGTVKLVVVEP